MVVTTTRISGIQSRWSVGWTSVDLLPLYVKQSTESKTNMVHFAQCLENLLQHLWYLIEIDFPNYFFCYNEQPYSVSTPSIVELWLHLYERTVKLTQLKTDSSVSFPINALLNLILVHWEA